MVKETTAFKKRELLTHMGKQKSRDDMEQQKEEIGKFSLKYVEFATTGK